MAVVINGVIVGEDHESLVTNGDPVYRCYANSSKTLVFDNLPPNTAIFTTDGTFTVPAGVSSVTLCMVGGGGAGGGNTSAGSGDLGGGHAGTVVSTTVAVTPGQNISVGVGVGGVGNLATHGSAGGTTTFGGLSAAGGAGGLTGTANYAGVGGANSTCGGTSNDGAQAYAGLAFYGGQGSGFGDGGDTLDFGADPGGVGAGGGAAYSFFIDSAGGAGGRGEVRLTWTVFTATFTGQSIVPTLDQGMATSGSLWAAQRVGVYGTWQAANGSGYVTGDSFVGFFGSGPAFRAIAGGSGGTIAVGYQTGYVNYYGNNIPFDLATGYSGTSTVPEETNISITTSGGAMRVEWFGYGAGGWITLT
jgi:hypothetical protein